ncbi:tautomerase family protein [Bacillus sp. C1]
MPFVTIYYPEKQLRAEELKQVSNGIHHSLMEHFHIPEKDYFHMFLPYPPQQFFYDPHYLLEKENERTDQMIHVSITCGPGRTVQQKQHLYQAISEALYNDTNISTANIFITLHETAAENWSFGQGMAQMVTTEGKIYE